MAFEWLNEESQRFLSRGYLVEGETAQDRIRNIANKAEGYLGISGFANKFYDYMGRGYFSLSSPVWANYGLERGLPVSCFGSYIEDNMESILYSHAENGMLMKGGGGTSGYFGELRHRGAPIKGNGQSNGAVHFIQLFDTLANVVSQGNVRRGYFSGYLPIDHPDADEFLDIGTEGNPIQGLTTGVTVSNEFMKRVVNGDKQARQLWAKVLKRRSELGFPYIFFTDNVNNGKPEVYKDKDMKVFASNMCSEIALPSNADETFTCVLSSINLLHWDELKNTDAIETLTMFLDTVVTEFIKKTEGKKYYERAHNFAKRHRALGLGVLGWHSYLQSNMLSFESREAAQKNVEIAKTLKERTHAASVRLAQLFGEPDVLRGYGRRNTTLMAVAPTKSSSTILGQVSQSIEPEFSNFYIKDLSKTKITVKNPYLKAHLQEIGKDTDEVWESIRLADGSVQHLEFLSTGIRNVFKTFAEISPYTIIDQAAIRQEYIDQAQSLNLMVPPDMPAREINALYMYAHGMGVKTLYYQYGMSQAQVLSRKKALIEGCAACEA
jgi:ribonucleoside-diphosphate reductase alpha chain